MTTSEDVSNLFRKFGGKAEQYQELSREGQAEESKARWPLLVSLRLTEHAVAPSVRDGRPPVVGAPVPNLRGGERKAGMSPFAPVPEVTHEALHDAVRQTSPGQGAAAGGIGRTFFRKAATPRTPSSSRSLVHAALRRTAEPSSGGAHGLSFLRAGSPSASGARADASSRADAPRTTAAVFPSAGSARGDAAGSPRAAAGVRQAASSSIANPSGLHRLSVAAPQHGPAGGERALAPLVGALGAASVASAAAAAVASATASGIASGTASAAVSGASGAASGLTQAPASRADAIREDATPAAPAGSRPLSAVFSRLMAEQPAPLRAAGPQKSSLFARLSRL
ncbi:MAG: cellulose biosynthesis protein BcsP [Janthinobacterium lividum]